MYLRSFLEEVSMWLDENYDSGLIISEGQDDRDEMIVEVRDIDTGPIIITKKGSDMVMLKREDSGKNIKVTMSVAAVGANLYACEI